MSSESPIAGSNPAPTIARDGRGALREDERATLVDILVARAGTPGGFAFLPDGERIAEAWTWSDLLERVHAVSAWLSCNAQSGDRALLFFRAGLDFIAAFYGCLHAGVVAVPCVPPSRPVKRSFERIREIARVAEPQVVLSTGATYSCVKELTSIVPELARCPAIDSPSLPASLPLPSRARQHGTALLQFTSGSTSAPKGVAITNANLVHNQRCIADAFAHDTASVTVSWLPAFHDMGLADGVLEPVYGGFQCYLMPPHAFLQRPSRWLRALSRFRGTHAGAPNFAYDLCVEKVTGSEVAELDLTRWRLAFNGAEPVRPSTLAAFARRFEAAGFREQAFHPCYGLAEATLKVSGASALDLHPLVLDAGALEEGDVRDASPASARTRAVASVGPPYRFELAVVDPETCATAAEGRVGEIWLRGPSVAAGYFRNREATAETFGGRLRGDSGGPYLRTGDLGFLRGGELYVTGRRKDMVIVGGRNLYPHDVERSVECADPAIAFGSSCAFAIDDGSREHLVVLFEAPSGRAGNAPLLEAAAHAVVQDHQVEASLVAIVPRGALLKTSSGKLRRGACAAAFRAGALALLEERGERPCPR
jgi:acyl-CoA synthetase (AMP-forming)/AMP-acid ligase II